MSDEIVYHNPNLAYHYYMMVAHASDPRILLLPGDGGWALPQFEPEEHFHGRVTHISREIKRQLGLDTAVLSRSSMLVDREDKKRADAIFALESLDPEWTPPEGAMWAGLEELAGLTLAMLEQREVIETWLQQDE